MCWQGRRTPPLPLAILGLWVPPSVVGGLKLQNPAKASNPSKKYRPPHPKGMKGGCSPQNNLVYGT